MVSISRSALLSPRMLLDSTGSLHRLSGASQGQAAQRAPDSRSVGTLRWVPLFAEPTEDGLLATSVGRGHSLGLPQGAPGEPRDWEVLRLQLRVKTRHPHVVALGLPSSGRHSPVKRLRPCSVQEVPLRFRNEGFSDVRVSVHPNLQSLEVRWRGPKQSSSSETSRNDSSNSNSSSISRNEGSLGGAGRTAWLLRVREDELDDIRQQADPARTP